MRSRGKSLDLSRYLTSRRFVQFVLLVLGGSVVALLRSLDFLASTRVFTSRKLSYTFSLYIGFPFAFPISGIPVCRIADGIALFFEEYGSITLGALDIHKPIACVTIENDLFIVVLPHQSEKPIKE